MYQALDTIIDDAVCFLSILIFFCFSCPSNSEKEARLFCRGCSCRLRNAVLAAQSEGKSILPALKVGKGVVNNGMGKLQRCSGKN